MTDTPVNNQAGRKFILVIEDDKFYGNIFKTKFTEVYDIIVAVNGKEGIEEAKKRKPDLILLDLIMPMQDGFETLQELKADPVLKDVNVIILSNLGQENDIKKAKDLGAIDYLIKANVSLQEAVDKVKQYLK